MNKYVTTATFGQEVLASPGRTLVDFRADWCMPCHAVEPVLAQVAEACERLRSQNVTPLSFFAIETDEPSVIGWMPAAAVYFRDPDGHLLEYLAMLGSAPDPDAGIVPWSQWPAVGSSRLR
jgi:thiol-disulfide isomerase/thioredoxin